MKGDLCSILHASFLMIFCVFVVSSQQRRDWTMNASSVVSRSTHQRSFNATWSSTALKAWVEPSSVRSALQVCAVHAFGHRLHFFKLFVPVNFSGIYILSMQSVVFPSIFIYLFIYFSARNKRMGSKWVGKGQANTSTKNTRVNRCMWLFI